MSDDLKADKKNLLDVVNKVCLAGNDEKRKPLGDFHIPLNTESIIKIGQVTATFLSLESSVKNCIKSYYPEYPSELIRNASVQDLLKILIFVDKNLRLFFERASKIRNAFAHNLHAEKQIKDDALPRLLKHARIAFPVLDLHVLEDKSLDPIEVYIFICMGVVNRVNFRNQKWAVIHELFQFVEHAAYELKTTKKEQFELLKKEKNFDKIIADVEMYFPDKFKFE